MKYPQFKEYKENNNKYFLATLMLLSFFLLWIGGTSDVFYNIIFKIASPFWKIENYLSDRFSLFMINFDEKAVLSEQNEILNRRVNASRFYQTENKLLKEELTVLKRFVGRNGEQNIEESGGQILATDETKLAYVLAGTIDPPYDTLIIDLGKGKIHEGSPVIQEDGYVVGSVSEIHENFSKIKMFSSFGTKTNIYLGENKTMVTMVGAGSGNFNISVPKEFVVEKDDYAIYPGEGTKMIATVRSVEYKSGETFKQVVLSIPFNIKNIRMVGVLNNAR